MELIVAADKGDNNEVKRLLDQGADVNAQEYIYGTALQTAAVQGHQKTVNLLLDREADINAQSGNYGNALQAAEFHGYHEIVDLFLDLGADINAQVVNYGNALQAAVFVGNQKIVNLLLDRGANINAQGGVDGNALQVAVVRRYHKMAELLVEKGADVSIQPKLADRRSLLHVVVESSDLAFLKKLCDAGADIHLETQDEFGMIPLHTAVNTGRVDIVEYLLELGASPNIEDLEGTTPLQLALRKENCEIALLLYPRTTVGLSSICASDWQHCSGHIRPCNLEMISGESDTVAFRDQSLVMELSEMSYPLSFNKTRLAAYDHDFINEHRDTRRMLLVSLPLGLGKVHCAY